MAQVTIYKELGIEVTVVDGEPPVDRTSEVATLTAERDAARSERDALQAKLHQLNADIDAAQGQA